MKTNRAMLAIAGIAMMAVVAVMFSACEKDKNTDTVDDLFNDTYVSADRDKESPEDLSISPSSPSVSEVGEQVAFTVRGGRKPYKWSVSDTAAGSISPSTTSTDIPQSVYKCLKLSKNTVIVTDGLGRAATVDVAARLAALSISPSSATLAATLLHNTARTVQFTAVGGSAPFSWTTSQPDFGNVSGAGLWTSDNATSSNTWKNVSVVITLTDDNGESATATIDFN